MALIIERPIPFYVPHFRSLSKHNEIDLQVIYLSDAGLKPFTYHGVQIEYDEEMLRGYSSIILGRGHSDGTPKNVLDRLLPELWRVMGSKAYDAVLVHGYNLPGHWIGFVTAILKRIPILLRGESELMFKRSWLTRTIKKIAFGWLFPKISAFMYIGSLNRDFYRYYGVADDKLFSMPYGIDNEWFFGSGSTERDTWRREVRAKLDISDDSIVFINHSKHRFPKRPADVVKAFARTEPNSNAVLLLVGDGDQRLEIDAACSALVEGQRVIRLGFQAYHDLRRILVASDVLVFASEENWGMAVNEGLAAGLAIICSDKVAGAVDMIDPGVNGYLFESRNNAELAKLMSCLINDPALVARMRDESRKLAHRFSFESMNEGLMAALKVINPTSGLKSP